MSTATLNSFLPAHLHGPTNKSKKIINKKKTKKLTRVQRQERANVRRAKADSHQVKSGVHVVNISVKGVHVVLSNTAAKSKPKYVKLNLGNGVGGGPKITGFCPSQGCNTMIVDTTLDSINAIREVASDP